MMATLRRWFSGLWRSFRALFSFRAPDTDLALENPPGRAARVWRVTWRAIAIVFLFLFVVWNATFLWNVLWTRGYTLSYPEGGHRRRQAGNHGDH